MQQSKKSNWKVPVIVDKKYLSNNNSKLRVFSALTLYSYFGGTEFNTHDRYFYLESLEEILSNVKNLLNISTREVRTAMNQLIEDGLISIKEGVVKLYYRTTNRFITIDSNTLEKALRCTKERQFKLFLYIHLRVYEGKSCITQEELGAAVGLSKNSRLSVSKILKHLVDEELVSMEKNNFNWSKFDHNSKKFLCGKSSSYKYSIK